MGGASELLILTLFNSQSYIQREKSYISEYIEVYENVQLHQIFRK